MNNIETVHAFLFFMSLGLNLVFGRILWDERSKWEEPFFGAAVGIFVYHLGETGRQGWYWIWRHLAGSDETWTMGPLVLLLYAFSAVLLTGAACKVRVFSSERYGKHLWIWIVLGSAVLTFGVMQI